MTVEHFFGAEIMAKSAQQVIDNARQKLRTARFGLEDMNDPHRIHSGLYNAVVFGRMVTFALQNLRSVVDDFDEWYEPKQELMKQDELMRYFHDLRTKIEKTTESHTSSSLYIRQLTPADIRRFYPGPPGALGFFMGDENGGSGWTVLMPDGSIDKYYIDLPPEIGETTLLLPQAPAAYRSQPAKELVGQYLNSLELLLNEARERFLD